MFTNHRHLGMTGPFRSILVVTGSGAGCPIPNLLRCGFRQPSQPRFGRLEQCGAVTPTPAGSRRSEWAAGGAGEGSRTLISSLGSWGNDRYTTPAGPEIIAHGAETGRSERIPAIDLCKGGVLCIWREVHNEAFEAPCLSKTAASAPCTPLRTVFSRTNWTSNFDRRRVRRWRAGGSTPRVRRILSSSSLAGRCSARCRRNG